jgi:hypothetical protein
MIGELRQLHRHLWLAWVIVVAVVVAFVIFMEP